MQDTPELNAAILLAKANFGPLERKGDNTFLKAKYVRLDDLLDAIVPALTSAGLLLEQETGSVRETHTEVRRDERQNDKHEPAHDPVYILTLTTRLIHVETGQVREHASELPFAPERGISLPQSLGKAITYLRRYALTAMFGITTEDDIDAQPGEQRQQRQQKSGQATPAQLFIKEWKRLHGEKAQEALDKALGVGDKKWSDVKNDEAWLRDTLNAARGVV